jgi:hypothetical protein
MFSSNDLLRIPVTYDIIVGDFGRDAAIEYLRLLAKNEKKTINSILKHRNLGFFDEYRRMMFTVIADLAFLKKDAIGKSASNDGIIKEDILIGVGTPTIISMEFVNRISLSVIQEVLSAIDRGHDLFRVMIVCNTLSDLAIEIGKMIHSTEEVRRIVETNALSISNFEKIANVEISVHTVPEAVMQHLVDTNKTDEVLHILVLGTRGTNSIYAKLAADSRGISILPIEDWEYELIDETVVASIGGDQNEIGLCCEQLRTKLIKHRAKLFKDLVVLEACTDFHLGLGISSLEVFAEAMVVDCYSSSYCR